PGGGGKKLVEKDPTLLADLMAMVEPDARGDPMSPLRWTCKSLSQLASALVDGEPVISVDTKKKELVGNFKNAGRTWRPKGEPEEVRVHDFLIEELGR